MLTHTITINATHTMILLPILKPLDKTQPHYDEISLCQYHFDKNLGSIIVL